MISFKVQSLDQDETDMRHLHKAIVWIGQNTNGGTQIFTDADWVRTKIYWVSFVDHQEGMVFKLTWSDRVNIVMASSAPE